MPTQRAASELQPVHVILRVREEVWAAGGRRPVGVLAAPPIADFRLLHFAARGGELHLIVEARGERALADGVRAISLRLARGRPTRAERWEARALRTPDEVVNALRAVLGAGAPRGGWSAVEPAAHTPRAAAEAQPA